MILMATKTILEDLPIRSKFMPGTNCYRPIESFTIKYLMMIDE